MYRYATRCILYNIRRRLSNIAKSRRIDATRLAYRYIRKLIGRKKGSREIMRNGREGGERQIYVNRQRRMKCQKFWWKSGSHENRDISGILQYFAKPFLDLHRRRNGLHFLLISFFLRPNIRQKAMETEGTLRDFLIFHDFQSWISRERNEIKIRTLFRWNRLAILNRIDLVRIFRVLFRITIRKWPPEKRGHFGPFEWEIAC